MKDESPPSSGFLYAPRWWPHDKPWAPEPGQCRAGIYDSGRSLWSHQCRRKAKVTRTVEHHGEIVEVEYCGIHDPVAVKAKRDARDAKWNAEWAAQKQAAAEKKRAADLHAAALAAIKQIASGHNDPRSLALEVLAQHGEPSDAA